MNTPAHLIIGAAMYARPGMPYVILAALAGAFVPDASLYFLAGFHLFVLGTPEGVVFGQLYFSDSWQLIFAIDNSFFLWGLLFGLAHYLKNEIAIAFSGSGFMHLVCDFPLHHDDGRMHFWPFSDWIFESPVSYWDHRHYGNIVEPLEILLTLVLLVVIALRFRSVLATVLLAVAGVLQLMPYVLFRYIFS